MSKNRLPGFTAAPAHGAQDYRISASVDLPRREQVVVPAFRVNCGPGRAALGATCTLLGAPAGFIPCFGNSGCMWFHAGLANPACFTCSYS